MRRLLTGLVGTTIVVGALAVAALLNVGGTASHGEAAVCRERLVTYEVFTGTGPGTLFFVETTCQSNGRTDVFYELLSGPRV